VRLLPLWRPDPVSSPLARVTRPVVATPYAAWRPPLAEVGFRT
jgi:hypothetical protein